MHPPRVFCVGRVDLASTYIQQYREAAGPPVLPVCVCVVYAYLDGSLQQQQSIIGGS